MEHNNNFNLMRLIFSIMVVFSHSYGLLALSEPIILNRTFGNFAVHCFFVLSGYLITNSFLKSKGIIEFTYRRVLRILPAFLVAYILSKILVKIFNGFSNNPVPYIVNGNVWTLSWEILAYIICAFVGFLGLLKAESLGTIWLAAWVGIIIFIDSQLPMYQIVVPMLFLFLAGSFLAVNGEKLKIPYTGLLSVLLLILMEIKPQAISKIIGFFPWLYSPSLPYNVINYFLYLLILPFALIYIGKYLPFKLNLKNDISYGVYIYTWPIQQVIVFIFLKQAIPLSPLLLFVLSILTSSIISGISWKFIEKPALSLKRIDLYSLFTSQKDKLLKG